MEKRRVREQVPLRIVRALKTSPPANQAHRVVPHRHLLEEQRAALNSCSKRLTKPSNSFKRKRMRPNRKRGNSNRDKAEREKENSHNRIHRKRVNRPVLKALDPNPAPSLNLDAILSKHPRRKRGREAPPLTRRVRLKKTSPLRATKTQTATELGRARSLTMPNRKKSGSKTAPTKVYNKG
jgi:hypothetical protein